VKYSKAMKRSTVAFFLLLAMIGISLLDTRFEGAQLILQTIPLCGLAALYGYPVACLGIAIIPLWLSFSSGIHPQSTHSWQYIVLLTTPMLTATNLYGNAF
jgi:hypothetical protein